MSMINVVPRCHDYATLFSSGRSGVITPYELLRIDCPTSAGIL